jgi:hypothetical protein
MAAALYYDMKCYIDIYEAVGRPHCKFSRTVLKMFVVYKPPVHAHYSYRIGYFAVISLFASHLDGIFATVNTLLLPINQFSRSTVKMQLYRAGQVFNPCASKKQIEQRETLTL